MSAPDNVPTGQWGRLEFERAERRRKSLLEDFGRVDLDTAIDDLRMWQARIMAPGSTSKMPSTGDFAGRWGWPKTTAHRLLRQTDFWSDPRARDEWNDRGTIVERQRNDRGTAAERVDADQERASDGAVERQWNEGGTKAERYRNEGGTGPPNYKDTTPAIRRSYDHDHDHDHKEQNTPPPPSPGGAAHEHGDDAEAIGVPKWSRLKGHRSHDVLGAVVRAIGAITGRVVNPERCATDAKLVIALQRATNTPWSELADQIELVAEWARDSDDPLAARDIRAEGWAGGVDRCRSVLTICVQGRWSERLQAAEDWSASSRDEHPIVINEERSPPRMRQHA